MTERYLGRIEPGFDVCDLDGEKVGSVAYIYRHDLAVVGSDVGVPPAGGVPPDEVLEVKTGFMGLGSHLYVPLSAVEDVTQGGVLVSKRKDEFESLGWHNKPVYLDQLQ